MPGTRAQLQNAAAFYVRLSDLFAAVDKTAGRKIRTSHDLRQIFDSDLRIFQQRQRRIDDLSEIVRRNLGGHADRDAVRTVDQRFGMRAGKTVGSLSDSS